MPRIFRVCLFLVFAFPIASATTAIQLAVDAREAPRNILHARLRITAAPGPLTLAYPKWMPGNHRPSGPIQNLTGIIMEANGRRVDWERDEIDPYSFHVTVPPGAHELDVLLDAVIDEGVAGSSGPAASSNVLDVNWNMAVLYPADLASDDVQVTPTVTLPDGWQFGTALEIASHTGDTIIFKPVSLTTLVDSPLIAASHFKRIVLKSDDNIPHALDMAAESDADLALTDKQLADVNNLVAQTAKLFGARHYRHYDFLLTLSDQVGGRGLEHHESSDNAPGERYLLNPEQFMAEGSLLPHEFTHSWNGKYRRPAGLVIKNYQQPMIDDLLWVYEGLTDYLGNVLAARSGFWTPEQFREALAETAARMDVRPGRTWRSLEDTTRSVQSLRLQGPAWQSWRRSLDYYPEGDLIWLEVDTKIRDLTHGRRSLDDFCRAFHGGESGPPRVVPYTFDQLVAALNQVAPFDWATLLHDRVDKVSEHAPLGGIDAGGWRLVYNNTPNAFISAGEHFSHGADYSFSLGFSVTTTGKLVDVIVGSPAYRAGLAPHMTLIAVNGRKFSSDALKEAVDAAAKDRQPISLIVENADFVKPYTIEYSGGIRYPHLERVNDKPDVLDAILKPR
jgi:predicted metalloprotease with PDZ domain